MVDVTKVTAVVTVYNNTKEQLSRCFCSLRKFGFNRILVVNDGSTSFETKCALKCAVDDGLIAVVNVPTNRGVSHAWMVGARSVQTEYMLKMDADDELTAQHSVDDTNFDICLTYVDRYPRHIPTTHAEFVAKPCPVLAGAIIRTSLAVDVFREYPIRVFDDVINYLKILDATKSIVVTTNVCYRYHPCSPSSLSSQVVSIPPELSDYMLSLAVFVYMQESGRVIDPEQAAELLAVARRSSL